MKNNLSFAAVFLTAVLLVSGCAAMTQQIGGKALPEPSAGFKPMEILPYSTSAVFRAAVEALEDSGATILQQSKENGRITTDYVAGPTQIAALGLLGGNSVRYKYLVSVKDRAGKTKLTVTVFLESSGNQVQSWRDVSADNPEAVASIQNALIEDIEKRLKK